MHKKATSIDEIHVQFRSVLHKLGIVQSKQIRLEKILSPDEKMNYIVSLQSNQIKERNIKTFLSQMDPNKNKDFISLLNLYSLRSILKCDIPFFYDVFVNNNGIYIFQETIYELLNYYNNKLEYSTKTSYNGSDVIYQTYEVENIVEEYLKTIYTILIKYPRAINDFCIHTIVLYTTLHNVYTKSFYSLIYIYSYKNIDRLFFLFSNFNDSKHSCIVNTYFYDFMKDTSITQDEMKDIQDFYDEIGEFENKRCKNNKDCVRNLDNYSDNDLKNAQDTSKDKLQIVCDNNFNYKAFVRESNTIFKNRFYKNNKYFSEIFCVCKPEKDIFEDNLQYLKSRAAQNEKIELQIIKNFICYKKYRKITMYIVNSIYETNKVTHTYKCKNNGVIKETIRNTIRNAIQNYKALYNKKFRFRENNDKIENKEEPKIEPNIELLDTKNQDDVESKNIVENKIQNLLKYTDNEYLKNLLPCFLEEYFYSNKNTLLIEKMNKLMIENTKYKNERNIRNINGNDREKKIVQTKNAINTVGQSVLVEEKNEPNNINVSSIATNVIKTESNTNIKTDAIVTNVNVDTNSINNIIENKNDVKNINNTQENTKNDLNINKNDLIINNKTTVTAVNSNNKMLKKGFLFKKNIKKVIDENMLMYYKQKYNPIRWNKVTKENSIWESIHKEYNTKELSQIILIEELMPFEKKEMKINKLKKDTLKTIFDTKKGNAIGIALGRIKMSDKEFKNKILCLQDEYFTENVLKQLIFNFPTHEEMKALQQEVSKHEKYNENEITAVNKLDNGNNTSICNSTNKLYSNVRFGRAEEFYLEFLDCYEVFLYKMKIMHFKIVYKSLCINIRNNMCVLTKIYTIGLESEGIKEFLKLSLFIGNVLNGDTFQGNAEGFKLDSINKFVEYQGNNKEKLIKYIKNKMKNDIKKDLFVFVNEKTNYDSVLLEIQEIEKNYKEIQNNVINADESDEKYIQNIINDYHKLENEYKEFKNLYENFITYFKDENCIEVFKILYYAL